MTAGWMRAPDADAAAAVAAAERENAAVQEAACRPRRPATRESATPSACCVGCDGSVLAEGLDGETWDYRGMTEQHRSSAGPRRRRGGLAPVVRSGASPSVVVADAAASLPVRRRRRRRCLDVVDLGRRPAHGGPVPDAGRADGRRVAGGSSSLVVADHQQRAHATRCQQSAPYRHCRYHQHQHY